MVAETVIGSGIGTVERDVNAARPVPQQKSAQDSPSRVPLVLMVRIMPMFSKPQDIVFWKSGKRSGSPPVRRRKVYWLLHLLCKQNPFINCAGVVPDIPFLNGTDGHNNTSQFILQSGRSSSAPVIEMLLARFLEKRTLEGGSRRSCSS